MDNLKEEFDHYIAGLAWSLWKELGVSGISRFHEYCLIQPEELVILTAIISKSDPRLRDEALDWLTRYHDFISVSRLKALLSRMGSSVELLFDQFATAQNPVSSVKWFDVKTDYHSKARMSGKSILPSLEQPSLLMLRLRSLFGPSAKADVLTYLMMNSKLNFSASDLVEIGYSKRGLMTALDNLAATGLIKVTSVRNKKCYELMKPRELQVVVGKLPAVAPPWSTILRIIMEIYTILPELQKSSSKTREVILRNCLIRTEHLLPNFISPILYRNPNFAEDWKGLMGVFKAFQQGNFFMHFQVHDEFDNIVIHFLSYLFSLDDCIDGIENIEHEFKFKTEIHAVVYKECYQLFLSFIRDLKVSLKQFLELPFHKVMDEQIADIPYSYSRDKLEFLTEKLSQIKTIDQINSPQMAVRQYQFLLPELHVLRQMTYNFRKRLADLYFVKTDVHLLTLPENLHKRHLVLELFNSA